MRLDVKLGIAVSMAVVLVAGVYFLIRGEQEKPIPIASDQVGQTNHTSPQSRAIKPNGARNAKRRSANHNQPRKLASTQRHQATPKRANHRTLSSKEDRLSGRLSAQPGGTARPVARSRKPGTTTATPDSQRRPLQPAPNRARNAGAPGRNGDQITRRKPALSSSNPAPGGNELANGRRTPFPSARQPGTFGTTSVRNPAGSMAAVDTHRVQPGDSFSSLAELYYGDKKFARFLADRNPQITDRNHLRVGALIKIPPRPSRSSPSVKGSSTTRRTSGSRTYRVKPGDSFYKIARDVLHDSSRWQELFQLNKDLVHGDPTHLQVGQEVVLPKQ